MCVVSHAPKLEFMHACGVVACDDDPHDDHTTEPPYSTKVPL
jgi:hypothetical protein